MRQLSEFSALSRTSPKAMSTARGNKMKITTENTEVTHGVILSVAKNLIRPFTPFRVTLCVILALCFLGEALGVAPLQNDSVKKYQSMIKQSPDFEPAWFSLQTAYIQTNDLVSAQKLEKIFLSDRLLWGYIRTLFYANYFDSTVKYIFIFSQKFPKSSLVNDAVALGILIVDCGKDTVNLKRFAQAQYNLERGNYNVSIDTIRALLVKSSNLAEYSYLLLSKLYISKGEINQAISTLNEFGQKFIQSKFYPKTRYELGMIYLESIKDTLKAKDIFENLISDCPESPESYFARSRLIIMSGGKTKESPAPK